jgi:hypothetical protein
MVNMVSLKKTKSDKKSENSALGMVQSAAMSPDDAGLRLDLDHHHLEKLGVSDMDHGDKVHFEGHGVVEKAESHSVNGEARHSATVRFHRGGMDHEQPRGEPTRDKTAIRGDLEKSYAGVQEKALPDKKGGGAAK